MIPEGVGSMGVVRRELDQIAEALREPQPPKRYIELYAAQQALSWALDPENYASPMVVIAEGRIVAPTGTLGD
jgi:hypothetical protein